MLDARRIRHDAFVLLIRPTQVLQISFVRSATSGLIVLYGLLKGSTQIFKQTNSLYVPGFCGNVHWLFRSAMLSRHGSHEPHDSRWSKKSLGSRTEYLGNGSQQPITHTGTTTIHTPVSSIPLRKVLCVPDIKKKRLPNLQRTENFNYTVSIAAMSQRLPYIFFLLR